MAGPSRRSELVRLILDFKLIASISPLGHAADADLTP